MFSEQKLIRCFEVKISKSTKLLGHSFCVRWSHLRLYLTLIFLLNWLLFQQPYSVFVTLLSSLFSHRGQAETSSLHVVYFQYDLMYIRQHLKGTETVSTDEITLIFLAQWELVQEIEHQNMVRQSSNKRVKFWKYYYYHYKFLLNANKIVVKFEEFHCDDRKPGFCFLLKALSAWTWYQH